MMGSHSFWVELSLPVVSQQFRPSTAILSGSGGFGCGLGVSAADSLKQRGRRCRGTQVELANSLRCRRLAAPLFNSFAPRSAYVFLWLPQRIAEKPSNNGSASELPVDYNRLLAASRAVLKDL
jgi:hypothetical protein